MNRILESGARKNLFEQRYKSSRVSLLLLIIFTSVNIVLLVTQSNTYFLFSATIPYFVVDMGMYLTGMYPPEYYAETGMIEFMDSSVFVFAISVAVLLLLLYFVCWLLSGKHKTGWLVTALVFFSLDTVAMIWLYGISSDMIMDVLFHVWVIVDLAGGIRACVMYNKAPAEPAVDPAAAFAPEGEAREDSMPMRAADMEVKARIFIKTEILGKEVIYRRVKRTNELVVDGKVYAEAEMLIETAHSLSAIISGHEIEVGFDGNSLNYAALDGQIIARKVRFI